MEATEIIKQDIVDHLTWDDSIDANEVYVHVENGNVQLKGKVPNFSAKIAAAQDAYMVAGVKNVDNQLEVGYQHTGKLPDDTAITSNVINMLLWNSNVRSSNIVVKSENRIVTLTGSVETYWEKYLAEDIANTAWGVIGVVNLLDVELTKTKVDSDIQAAIEDAFRRTVLIDEDRINVSVNNGVVTLTGSVMNYAVKRDALDIAMYTAGVVSVIDELTIE